MEERWRSRVPTQRRADGVSGLLAAMPGSAQTRSSVPGLLYTASSLERGVHNEQAGWWAAQREVQGRRRPSRVVPPPAVQPARRRLPAVWICVSTLSGRQLGGQAPARRPQPHAAPRVAAVALPVLFALPSPSLSGPTARGLAVNSASRAAGERIECRTRAPRSGGLLTSFRPAGTLGCG